MLKFVSVFICYGHDDLFATLVMLKWLDEFVENLDWR